jgi:hypothetical protein
VGFEQGRWELKRGWRSCCKPFRLTFSKNRKYPQGRGALDLMLEIPRHDIAEKMFIEKMLGRTHRQSYELTVSNVWKARILIHLRCRLIYANVRQRKRGVEAVLGGAMDVTVLLRILWT